MLHEERHTAAGSLPDRTGAIERESFPKLLLVTSSAFNRVTGSGITFGNLFSGWPSDRLATVHNDIVPVTTNVCENYYHLSTKEISKWGPLKLLSPPMVRRVAAAKGNVDRALRTLKQFVFGGALPESTKLSPELSAWIAEFRPDLIYSTLGSNGMMELVEKIRRKFDLPIVIHMMDDWPAVRYRGGVVSWRQRQKMRRLLDHLVSVAKIRLGICDYMSEAYQTRYGVPFYSFQNTLDTERWGKYTKSDTLIGQPVRLLYIGSIYANGQLNSLLDCCHAVARLREQGMAIAFKMYSPSFISERFRKRLVVDSSIFLNDTITDDETFFSELANADILVLPVNFDKATVRYIRYSMPTKVPAYLLSGTPILVYGPNSVAQVRYAKEGRWGYVVSQKGIKHVMNGIQRIVSDGNLRKELSNTASETAARNHDIRAVRHRFHSVLCDAAR